MAYVAIHITESFKMHLFTTWSISGVHQVFLLEHYKMKEWALETDGVNLKAAMCIPGISFSPMYLNNCIESFATLRVEAMCATIMKELINYPDTGALMHCSFEEMVEIPTEAAAIGENNDCHGIAKKVMFGQLAPMGTGAFDVTLDINILKDAIVNHHLLVQNILTAHMDCSMTPSQVVMMPYDTNSPAWSESNFKGRSVALSPLAINGREDPANFLFLGYGKSPLGAGDMSPTSPPGHSLSSPNAYSPTLPYVPQSPYSGMTSPFLQSATTFLQSHISAVLTNWPILCLQDLLCSHTNVTPVSKVLTHVTGVTLLTQIFQLLQVIFWPLLPSLPCFHTLTMTVIMGIICTANLPGSFTHTIAAFPTAPNDEMESPLTLMMMPTSFPFNHPQYSYTQPLCTLVMLPTNPPCTGPGLLFV
ncbi:hypothetical protein F5J12DRAFT_947886 [Pisolithus orientalis]|uniref:uncharacterized protein n=1 Tax=Pisolithus orientalis TaxID=936130 RepID=UPI0022256DA8|nr:uncharacterized protein F5J12DRAFT_947886 [Pisolithus orientalis]KAI6002405.1 hypothetical protein F5J12DRAFT_947886 [Pisolithus orientalis]